MTKRIWAPWRLEYILKAAKKSISTKSKKRGCVFCDVIKSSPSVKNLVLYKGRLAYVVMNKYPYTSGHLMVIPLRHVGTFADLTAEEHCELGVLLGVAQKILNKAYKPQGYNIGMNLGEVAGAGIREHVHYHIVPRWAGDHNFMPVVGELRVILEFLKTGYARLRKEFDKMSV